MALHSEHGKDESGYPFREGWKERVDIRAGVKKVCPNPTLIDLALN